jgi:fatty acid desaturase
LRDITMDVGAIIATALAAALLGHIVAPLVAICYIGVRQRHLSNLAHECVHAKLMATRRSNRVAGYLLTGLLGEGLLPYRVTHSVHHAKLGSDDDPMFQSYRAGNIRAAGTAPSKYAFILHVIARNAVWRLPTSALRVLLTKAPQESWRAPAARAATWAAVGAICWPFHAVGALLLYWFVPLVFVRPVVTWITDLGNHAGLIESPDVLLQTRGWSSHWLTRHLLGGHLDDQFHPIHHWCPRIPWRRLPLAAELAASHLDRWSEVPWCSGYFFRRRSTPAVPCVIEDIIGRLAQTPTRHKSPRP